MAPRDTLGDFEWLMSLSPESIGYLNCSSVEHTALLSPYVKLSPPLGRAQCDVRSKIIGTKWRGHQRL